MTKAQKNGIFVFVEKYGKEGRKLKRKEFRASNESVERDFSRDSEIGDWFGKKH